MKDLSILHIVLIYLVIINVVTFFMYGIDKAASKREQSQTRLSFAERKQARPKVKWKAKKSKWQKGSYGQSHCRILENQKGRQAQSVFPDV